MRTPIDADKVADIHLSGRSIFNKLEVEAAGVEPESCNAIAPKQAQNSNSSSGTWFVELPVFVCAVAGARFCGHAVYAPDAGGCHSLSQPSMSQPRRQTRRRTLPLAGPRFDLLPAKAQLRSTIQRACAMRAAISRNGAVGGVSLGAACVDPSITQPQYRGACKIFLDTNLTKSRPVIDGCVMSFGVTQ